MNIAPGPEAATLQPRDTSRAFKPRMSENTGIGQGKEVNKARKEGANERGAAIARLLGEKGPFARIFSTRNITSINSGAYEHLLGKRASFHGNENKSTDKRDVIAITVPEPPHGFLEHAATGLVDAATVLQFRKDEAESGMTLRSFATAFQEASEVDPRTGQAKDKAKQMQLARELVSANIPKEGLGKEEQRAVDGAILAAASITAEKVAAQSALRIPGIDKPVLVDGIPENEVYYNHAPHVVAVKGTDGTLTITTAYGPAEVTDEGAVIPTDVRRFGNDRWYQHRNQSRGPEKPGVEVSTVRIQPHNLETNRPDQEDITQWEVSYVGADGVKVPAVDEKYGVTRGDMSSISYDRVFRNAPDHGIKIYGHKGRFKGHAITIVSQSPRVEESQLERVADKEIAFQERAKRGYAEAIEAYAQRRTAGGPDFVEDPPTQKEFGITDSLVVTDIPLYTTEHVEGLQVTGVTRPEQTGNLAKKEIKRDLKPEATVYIRDADYAIAIQELNTNDYLRLLLDVSGKTGEIPLETLLKHRWLIDVQFPDVPPTGGKSVDRGRIDNALEKQADDVNYLSKRDRNPAERDVANIDPEVLLLVLSKELGSTLGIPEARQMLVDYDNPLLLSRDASAGTRRQQIRARLVEQFGERIFTNEHDRIIGEALLNKVAPRDPADFLHDVTEVEEEAKAAGKALVPEDGEVVTAEERINRSNRYSEAQRRLERVFAESGITEEARRGLEALMPEDGIGIQPETFALGLEALISREKAAIAKGSSREARRELARIDSDYDKFAKEHGLSQETIDRLRDTALPEDSGISPEKFLSDLLRAPTPEAQQEVVGAALEDSPEAQLILSVLNLVNAKAEVDPADVEQRVRDGMANLIATIKDLGLAGNSRNGR